jgi:SAM-dependent methyltransferase
MPTARRWPSNCNGGFIESRLQLTESVGDIVCPECEVSLSADDGELACSGCGHSWPIVNGIPAFVQDFPYWGEIPIEQMLEVNRRAENGAWKAALTDFADPVVQQASQMILNLDRANWQWLLDLPSESRVLDVGAGMGTNSHALALHYREVVALEPVLERVRFMQRRFGQERLSNIKIVRSSIWTLPFAPASFDLAVMNGVLEWVPESQPGDPGELQERALRRICRLLRPGGYVYVGIENRMGLTYFVGYPDPHCGVPFTTILPRPLANWYARRHGQSGYRNYLYSGRGYRKLLRRAGFREVEIYLALPSYNHPRFLIPLKRNVFSHYAQHFNTGEARWFWKLARRILLTSGFLKNFQYSYVILARK